MFRLHSAAFQLQILNDINLPQRIRKSTRENDIIKCEVHMKRQLRLGNIVSGVNKLITLGKVVNGY